MTSRVIFIIFKTYQQKYNVRQDLASNMHFWQTKSSVGAYFPMHCTRSQEQKLQQTVCDKGGSQCQSSMKPRIFQVARASSRQLRPLELLLTSETQHFTQPASAIITFLLQHPLCSLNSCKWLISCSTLAFARIYLGVRSALNRACSWSSRIKLKLWHPWFLGVNPTLALDITSATNKFLHSCPGLFSLPCCWDWCHSIDIITLFSWQILCATTKDTGG